MRTDVFQFTEFSKKMLEDCQKWRDENYERNIKKMNRSMQSRVHNK
jgi:hypothetical protein